MEVDSEGRMGNVFWSDARSRRAYGFFGDVVVFDTTFNPNRYGMVFAPLLGVNNHRQTVLFRRAFLTSETTNSFVWVLEEFKKAMLEKPDIGEYFSEMCKCIWGMDTKEEFDAKWEEILTNNGLKDHAWLSSIHAMRENWVPSYRHKQLMADHVDNNEKPPLPFQTPMQHQMGCIYTREILEMFEREDFRSLLCLFKFVEQDETHCIYKVEHFPNKCILKRWLQSAKNSVIYDKNHKEVNDCVDGLILVKRSKVCKVASDLIDSALLCDEGFELLEKSFDDIRGKLTSSSSSNIELGGPVAKNLQPTQSTQDSEPTMTESFMQELDFIYGLGV
ncbi:PREDICTED: protein FAR1-RELATED SEQUENCE 3-like [Prunus mume]|uniref:Protein FAR1-RELATED SEQUENCE n=1 Tax=Prunus mume TaxID=102107 RepID=A0ABM0PUG6_PRUMU|nr:PREDICTED: protein FAR1-RELATED SEQUENCE 3-like [Prunus mume]